LFLKNENTKIESIYNLNQELEEINVSHNGWQTVPVFIKLKTG